MQLTPGSRLGPFEITSQIGVGGMGVVYQALDTTLARPVALKVLPASVADDPDRLARFDREAKTLALLNHPNIAAIYGVEQGSGVRALVMELVEGPTLAERIGQGPIALEEVVTIARQIAEALEAAHDQGIVHRDLKPANIKVRRDGTVKVLDFGLAKALEPGAGAEGSQPYHATYSPTITSPAMTRVGVILGTAAYMSPEQAAGKSVDKRSDLWSFGLVLFEMLTGRQVFTGDTVTHVLAAVLKDEPDWSALPEQLPPSIRRLLRRCLQKDRKQRLDSAQAARLELDEAFARSDEAVRAVKQPEAAWRRVRDIAVGVTVATAVLATAAWLTRAPIVNDSPVTRSLLAFDPFDQRNEATPGESGPAIARLRPDRTALALSPDGRTLIVRAVGTRGAQLYMRPLDRLELVPLAGTERAEGPFFSPDGRWIAFWADGELRKMSLAGGPVTRICIVPDRNRLGGAAWGDGDVIVFATFEGIWRVPAAGGQPEILTRAAAGETHRLPHLLPRSEEMLFTVTREEGRWDNAQVVLRSLRTGEQRTLVEDAADARYVFGGHLVFARRGSLMAAPFDLQRRELTAGAVTIIEDVLQSVNTGSPGTDSGAAQFAASGNGTIVYATGGESPDRETVLLWVDRDGRQEALSMPTGRYLSPRLSPDQQRIAVHTASTATINSRVWIYDIRRRTMTPFTSLEERGAFGLWTPDGTRLVYLADLGAAADLWSKPSGGGAGERLTNGTGRSFPASWTPDGRQLVFIRMRLSIALLDLTDSQRSPSAVAQTPNVAKQAALSPDGRWLAFASNDSGRDEVYVQPFPGPGARIPISTAGGHSPAWRGDGQEIYFFQPASDLGSNAAAAMMAVRLTSAGGGLKADAPVKLFDGRFGVTVPVRGYDVTPDGRRFLMVRRVDQLQQRTQLVLVQNWHSVLQGQPESH